MTDAELISILQQQVADARADTERVTGWYKNQLDYQDNVLKTDKKRLDWLLQNFWARAEQVQNEWHRLCAEDCCQDDLRCVIDALMEQESTK